MKVVGKGPAFTHMKHNLPGISDVEIQALRFQNSTFGIARILWPTIALFTRRTYRPEYKDVVSSIPSK
jgi:hypothetical protein